MVFYGPRPANGIVDIAGRESIDSYEGVRLAREHNNANIISIAARFVSDEEAKKALKLFLETNFYAEERHVRRINKLEPNA